MDVDDPSMKDAAYDPSWLDILSKSEAIDLDSGMPGLIILVEQCYYSTSLITLFILFIRHADYIG